MRISKTQLRQIIREEFQRLWGQEEFVGPVDTSRGIDKGAIPPEQYSALMRQVFGDPEPGEWPAEAYWPQKDEPPSSPVPQGEPGTGALPQTRLGALAKHIQHDWSPQHILKNLQTIMKENKMKISKTQLRQIIREAFSTVLSEQPGWPVDPEDFDPAPGKKPPTQVPDPGFDPSKPTTPTEPGYKPAKKKPPVKPLQEEEEEDKPMPDIKGDGHRKAPKKSVWPKKSALDAVKPKAKPFRPDYVPDKPPGKTSEFGKRQPFKKTKPEMKPPPKTSDFNKGKSTKEQALDEATLNRWKKIIK